MDLDKLEKLCRETTKGPWYIENLYSKSHYPEIFKKKDGHWQSIACEVRKDADAIFIAEARTALPELIERVREVEDIAGKLLKNICSYCPPWYREDISKCAKWCEMREKYELRQALIQVERGWDDV